MRTRGTPAASLHTAALALATATVGVVIVACGGSEAQEVLADRSAPASTVPTSSGTSGASGASGGTSGSSGSSGSSGTDASVECPEEVEPNNNEDSANVLAPSRCGAITPNSESDFLTFELSPTATSMQIRFDGKVTLRVRVADQSILLGGSTSPKVPFLKGETYVIEIKATTRENRVPWRVDLIEK